MIGEDFILEFFNQFGPFALALLSFTEAIIQPIPPDVMFLPMAYDERNSVNMLLWLWFIVTFASVLGAMVGHTLGKRYGTKLLDRFGKHIIESGWSICSNGMASGGCSSQLFLHCPTKCLDGSLEQVI